LLYEIMIVFACIIAAGFLYMVLNPILIQIDEYYWNYGNASFMDEAMIGVKAVWTWLPLFCLLAALIWMTLRAELRRSE